jgi:hypothetical protein
VTPPNAFDPPKLPFEPTSLPPVQSGGTYVDEQNNIHTVRPDGTEEITHATDGHVSTRPPGAPTIHHPAPPPRPTPKPGERTTFNLTGTDGSVLEITPWGQRTLIEPNGSRQSIGTGDPAPPVVTYDNDGTKHIYDADGTHTIVEDFVQTVIPPQPLRPHEMNDLKHRPPPSAPDVANWSNDQPDGSTTRSYSDGTIESLRGEGTRVIHPPPLLPSTDRARQETGASSVDPDGTLRHRQEDGALVTTRPDGTTLLTAADGATLLTRPDGTRDRIPRPPDLPDGKHVTFTDQDALLDPKKIAKAKPRPGCLTGIVTALTVAGIAGALAWPSNDSDSGVVSDRSFEAATVVEAPATTIVPFVVSPPPELTTTIAADTTVAPDTTTAELETTTIAEVETTAPAPETIALPPATAAPRTFAGQMTSLGGEPPDPRLIRNEVQLTVTDTSLAIIMHVVEDAEFGFDESATPACFRGSSRRRR